jgi:metallo-beta-lactamase class B
MYPWRFRVAPFRIAGNLYYVGNADVSSHLIDTGDGLILIDTAFPQTVYLLLESIRRLGFDPDDICLIVHCHGHYDHFGGTRALVELTGARTALGEADIEILTSRPDLSWAPEYGVPFYETFEVDEPLTDGQVVSLGDTTIECVNVPGHTPGSMSLLFEVTEGGRSLAAGLHGGPGLNTLSEAYLAQYGLSMERRVDYLGSLKRVGQRTVDIHLGGHPEQNDTLGKRARMRDGEVNPFIDASCCPRYLAELEANARTEFGLS